MRSHDTLSEYSGSQSCVCTCAGDDAVKFESLPDEVVVAKALSVLRSIFGDTSVPEVSSHMCACVICVI